MRPVDFLPERIRIQQARRRSLIRQACMLGVCLLALVALGYLRQGRVSRAQAELGLLRQRSVNMQAQIATRAMLEAEQAELMVKQRIDEHLGTRVNVLDVLGELQNVMSNRLSLTELTIEALEITTQIERIGNAPRSVHSPIGAGADVYVSRRIQLAMKGLAPTDIDVANFIGQLASSPLFEDVNMGYSKAIIHKDHEAREFQASCFIAR
ncbi:MAG: PilN domain-containing protein [Planctomycetota bacterium]